MKVYIFTATYQYDPLQILKIFSSLDKAKEFGEKEYNLCESGWTEWTSESIPNPKWFYASEIDQEFIYRKYKTSYDDFCIVEMEVE